VRNLTTHVNDVVNLVKWKDLKDIILVGHSSAGFVITQAAEQFGPSVASIVYLDAFVPQADDNLISFANPGPRKALEDAVARGDLAAKPIPAAAFKANEKDRPWAMPSARRTRSQCWISGAQLPPSLSMPLSKP
jgi:pimeloyl-ACP methyl ester carboxylesterase